MTSIQYASLAEVNAAIDTLLRPVGVTACEYMATYCQEWAFPHHHADFIPWTRRTDGAIIADAAAFLARADELEKVAATQFNDYVHFVAAHDHAVFIDAAAFRAAMAPLLHARAELVLALQRVAAAAMLSA